MYIAQRELAFACLLGCLKIRLNAQQNAHALSRSSPLCRQSCCTGKNCSYVQQELLKEQKDSALTKVFLFQYRWVSIHQKATRISKRTFLKNLIFKNTIFLFGARKTNSKNSSIKNITYELGACNYTLSFETKDVAIAICPVFYRMNHVSSLRIHYECKALLRLIIVSGSSL